MRELGRVYELLEREDDLRCGVLFAHGEHLTGRQEDSRSGTFPVRTLQRTG